MRYYRKVLSMSIFESLENLEISEECFNDIMNIIEAKLIDRMTIGQLKEIAGRSLNSKSRKLFGRRYERARALANIDKTRDNYTIRQAQEFANHRIKNGATVFPKVKNDYSRYNKFGYKPPKPYVINGTEEDHVIASLGKQSTYKRPPRRTRPVFADKGRFPTAMKKALDARRRTDWENFKRRI